MDKGICTGTSSEARSEETRLREGLARVTLERDGYQTGCREAMARATAAESALAEAREAGRRYCAQTDPLIACAAFSHGGELEKPCGTCRACALAALAEARGALSRIETWAHTYGAALTPPGADTYGEGMRAAKEQVAALARAGEQETPAAGSRLEAIYNRVRLRPPPCSMMAVGVLRDPSPAGEPASRGQDGDYCSSDWPAAQPPPATPPPGEQGKGGGEGLRVELANHLLYVHPLPWRVGRKVARNVYDAHSEGVAMFTHAYTAAVVVEAVNRLAPAQPAEHPASGGEEKP